jgi:geranylgeranyl diphosphate synthase type I
MTVRVSESVPALSPSAILARCNEVVEPALEDAVARLHPWPRRMASFALGWCDVDGGRVRGGGGKGVRQALAVLSAEAVGAPAETAVPGAVGVELVHVFSLVHDDIMDADEQRRHRPTVWKAYGTAAAVLAGDALFALAIESVARADDKHGLHPVSHLAGALTELVCGQAQDVEFEARPWTGAGAVTLDEYRDMAEHKTGALLGCSASIGAVLAGASSHTVDALSEAGRQLGLVFQAGDDLLGIWGEPAVTGKPVLNDLRRGKKTLPVLAAIASGTPAGERLAEALSCRERLEDHELAWLAGLVDEAGGRSFVQRESEQHLECAVRILEDADLVSPGVNELCALARFLVSRTS